MKKTIKLLVLLLAGATGSIKAQYSTHYFENPETIKRENVELDFKNVVSKEEYIKFALTLNNTSNDFVILNFSDGTVNANGEKLKAAKQKTILCPPNESKKKTFDVKGSNLLVNDFTCQFDKFFLIPSNGKVVEMPEFKLPAEKNSFSVGNFKIELSKLKKKTDLTVAKFYCTYLGDDYGIIRPNSTSVRVKEDRIFANETRVKEHYLMKKGDKIPFTLSFRIEARVVDMQFADMFINWNDMFQESKEQTLKGETIRFKLDDALTKEKN